MGAPLERSGRANFLRATSLAAPRRYKPVQLRQAPEALINYDLRISGEVRLVWAYM
jgi:hypothetical protein